MNLSQVLTFHDYSQAHPKHLVEKQCFGTGWNIFILLSGKKIFALILSEPCFTKETADEPTGRNKGPGLCCLQIWLSVRANRESEIPSFSDGPENKEDT